MANDTVIVPMEKTRQAALDKMNEDLRALAIDADSRRRKCDAGNVIVRYDLGSMIKTVVTKESQYGAHAVELLATFLNEQPTVLYGLRDLAETFDRDYILHWTQQPMCNGRYLTEKHWMVVRLLTDRNKQESYLKKVLKNGMSANDLYKEIQSSGAMKKNVRSGGRKAAAPTSALGGLQKLGKLTQTLFNYEEQHMEAVFEIINEMPPDDVTEVYLERLNETATCVEKAFEALEDVKKKLSGNIKRVKTVLSQKPAEEKAEKAEKKEKVDKKAEKSEKKEGKKEEGKKDASSNGHDKSVSGKKKSSKPKAATV